MKNKILYLLAIVLMTGCSFKMEYDGQSPDEQIARSLELYTDILLSSPNGWFLDVSTGVSGGFRHWVAFNADNRVSMLSDMDVDYDWSNSSTDIKDSSWYLKYDQMPMLKFDTYSYLHYLADPQGNDNASRPGNGGANGAGLVSDFEFYIEGVENGTLLLRGRYNKRSAKLTAATAAETAAVMNGDFKTIHEKTNAFIAANDFIVGRYKGVDMGFTVSPRRVMVQYIDGGRLASATMAVCPDFSSVTEQNKPCSNIIVLDKAKIAGTSIASFECDGERFYIVTEDGNKTALDFVDDMPFPLNLGYNKDFTVLDFSVDLPGTHSQEFVDFVFRATIDDFQYRRSPRVMDYMYLTFAVDVLTRRQYIQLVFRYTSGSNYYDAIWRYQFTDNGDGTITITDRDQSGSTNESFNEIFIKPILNYFCHVTYSSGENTEFYSDWVKSSVVPKTFRIEWIKNKTPGSGATTGALVPVDTGNDPDFMPYPCIGVLK